MIDAIYRIVEHDGGWAYKLGDVFSETFPSRRAAEAAAHRVAREQQVPGDDEGISWEDEAGVWHDEAARGTDRPHAYVAGAEDRAPAGPALRHPTGRDVPTRGMGDYAFAAYDRGDQYARRGTRLAREKVRSDPVLALLLAVGCGFMLGLLIRGRS